MILFIDCQEPSNAYQTDVTFALINVQLIFFFIKTFFENSCKFRSIEDRPIRFTGKSKKKFINIKKLNQTP